MQIISFLECACNVRSKHCCRSAKQWNLQREWVPEQLSRVKAHHADGINIDFEDPIQKYSREYYALAELTKEVADVIHDVVHGSQVS